MWCSPLHDLIKETINMSVKLEKGHKVNLAKADGGQLSTITLGLGWDAATGFLGGSIDLDASAVLLDGSKNKVDVVYFGKLKSTDGSVRHTGDNLTGAGDGDDEQIIVDLTRVPASVQYLVFTVSSYRGQTFDSVKNAFVRVLDDKNTELCKYDLTAKGAHTALVMGKVYRHNGGWKFHAVGEPATGRTVDSFIDKVKAAC
jgi:tellurium resistance protein TerZ